jgi:hypothetical protein
MKLLAEAFPEFNTLPKSYDKAKSILKELGIGYESIHVCYNNYVLFRKQYAKLTIAQFVVSRDGKMRKKEDSTKGVATFSIST